MRRNGHILRGVRPLARVALVVGVVGSSWSRVSQAAERRRPRRLPPWQRHRRRRPPPPKTLYERLGGQPAVEAVVDEFLKRVAADKRINGRFVNTDLPRLRGLLVEFVCSATGGPCKYTGRDMRSAHAGMQLVDEEFSALVEDLVGALDKFNVPKAEKDELLGALGPLAKDIVNPPSAEAAAHDAALAKQAEAKVAELRKDGKERRRRDLLEVAVEGARARAALVRRAALQRGRAAGCRRRALHRLDAAVPRGRARADHDRAQDDARGHAAPQPKDVGRRLGRGRQRRRQAEERLAGRAR